MMAWKNNKNTEQHPWRENPHKKEKDAKLPQKAKSRSSYNDSIHAEHNVIG